MILADSNLIIYAASGEYPKLLEWFLDNDVSASAVSLVETLGYHQLKAREKDALQTIFSDLTLIYPNPEAFQAAVDLRQKHAMSLGDALIAATALTHDLTLATHNTKDFAWIKFLEVIDPLEE